MVEFDYTPRVAQETAGLGFTLPLPQRQQGVDVRNANPQTRAAQAASMPFYEQASDITSALTTLRDAYIADVQDLNTLVQEGVELGYDARTIDYQDPQSIEVNKRYREVLNRVKAKELELRNAKPLVDAVAKSRGVFNPEAMSYGEIDPFFGAAEAAAAFNQGVGTQGYGEEGMTEALKAKAQAEQNINAIYAPQFEKYKNNPAMMQSLEDKRLRDISSLQAISKKEAPREPRDPIMDFQMKEEIRLKMQSNKAYNNVIKDMTITPVSENLFVKGKDGKKVREIGQRYSAPLTKTMEPASVSAKYYDKGIQPEQIIGLDGFKYDAMEIVGIDKDGNVIKAKDTPLSQYDRFEVVMKGSASTGTKRIAVYDTYGNVVRGISEEEREAYRDVNNVLQQQAQNMTRALKGGASVPSAQPATQPTGTQGTNTTDVSSIFGRP